jgi:aromatic ring-cleaving dioxygenase
MTGQHNVFLSFARSDATHAEKLRRLLSARSDVRLLSSEDSGTGESWQAKLQEAVAKSDWFVLVLSPESLSSSWMLKELGAA